MKADRKTPHTPSEVQLRRYARARRNAWQARRIEDLTCKFIFVVFAFTVLCGGSDDALTMVVQLWLVFGGIYCLAAVWCARCLSRLEAQSKLLGIEIPTDTESLTPETLETEDRYAW